MRICFVFHTAYFFRYFDTVVRQLRARGHEVTVLVGDGPMSRNYTDRSLEACVAETGCRRERLQMPRSLIGRAMPRIRDFAGYGNYFRREHPARGWARQWRTYLDRRVKRLLDNAFVHWFVISPLGRRFLRLVDRLAPADSLVTARLSEIRPDVVVASPMVFSCSRDTEYVKAACTLGIPTVLAVASWDHLGGKGLCSVLPDAVLVWNEEMLREAVVLHDIPHERVAVVGAPPFDYWFEATPTVDRRRFLRTVGLAPETQYFVYLCSSNPIAGDAEPALVSKIAAAMARHPQLGGVRLLVRPYPAMSHIWKGALPANCTVWPPEGEWPDIPEARQNLFHTLHFSVGTIGLNTTAMLEAAVVDKPCIAILTEEYRRSQGERAHFQQMLRGRFLETPRSAEEAVGVMADIAAGKDGRREARLSFAQRFFRPLGASQPVGPLYAQAIERSGGAESTVTQPFASTSRASASPRP
jgi:hypothetical protein